MPKYIYKHPDTNMEVEIMHPMTEVKSPSKDLLKKITLTDGRIMKRKILAPALLGFDNLGRSTLSKKETEPKGECGKSTTENKCDCAQSPVAAKSAVAPSLE